MIINKSPQQRRSKGVGAVETVERLGITRAHGHRVWYIGISILLREFGEAVANLVVNVAS